LSNTWARGFGPSSCFEDFLDPKPSFVPPKGFEALLEGRR